MNNLKELQEAKFICSHCGQEYDFNLRRIKRYEDLDREVAYMRCPKDGSPAFPVLGEVEPPIVDPDPEKPTGPKEAIIGEGKIGEVVIAESASEAPSATEVA